MLLSRFADFHQEETNNMAVSILFLVQDVSVAPKFISNDFGKIVSTSYRIGRIFGKGSVVELWGNGAYVGGI